MSNPPRRGPPLYPVSIFLHLTSPNDRVSQELFDDIIKLLKEKGVKFNEANQYWQRRWNFLQSIEMSTLREEASEDQQQY